MDSEQFQLQRREVNQLLLEEGITKEVVEGNVGEQVAWLLFDRARLLDELAFLQSSLSNQLSLNASSSSAFHRKENAFSASQTSFLYHEEHSRGNLDSENGKVPVCEYEAYMTAVRRENDDLHKNLQFNFQNGISRRRAFSSISDIPQFLIHNNESSMSQPFNHNSNHINYPLNSMSVNGSTSELQMINETCDLDCLSPTLVPYSSRDHLSLKIVSQEHQLGSSLLELAENIHCSNCALLKARVQETLDFCQEELESNRTYYSTELETLNQKLLNRDRLLEETRQHSEQLELELQAREERRASQSNELEEIKEELRHEQQRVQLLESRCARADQQIQGLLHQLELWGEERNRLQQQLRHQQRSEQRNLHPVLSHGSDPLDTSSHFNPHIPRRKTSFSGSPTSIYKPRVAQL